MKGNEIFKEPYSTKMNISSNSNEQVENTTLSQLTKNKVNKMDSNNTNYMNNLSFFDAKDKNIEIEMQNLLNSSSKYNK